MITALLVVTIFLGLATLLSLENDKLKKDSLEAKRTEEDNVYKLSVIKDIQEKNRLFN